MDCFAVAIILLNICTVVPFGISTDCRPGTYGIDCRKTCSPHCAGPDNACHSTLGTCDKGCDPGYRPPRCTSECIPGTYGRECKNLCSLHCGGANNACDVNNGSCLAGCDDGYEGVRCNDKTSDGLALPWWVLIVPSIAFVIGMLICGIWKWYRRNQ
ncbi:hypothetical protein RRG08_053488 [Elysia crispata]|uniref:Uncharacterized protein n=1 Tax=Elysia crispata TaxID=231223 RepID=A0AAE1A106_9GAST|nr:hypothetical protein RRG08_053488 [Elysia crispata]